MALGQYRLGSILVTEYLWAKISVWEGCLSAELYLLGQFIFIICSGRMEDADFWKVYSFKKI